MIEQDSPISSASKTVRAFVSVLFPSFLFFIILFISPPQLLAVEEAVTEDYDQLRRHLLLISKRSIVLQQEMNEWLKKPPAAENSGASRA